MIFRKIPLGGAGRPGAGAGWRDPVLWLILLVGAAARFWKADAFSYGFDEALSLTRALQPDVWSVIRSTFVETPFFNVLLHGWIVLGRDEATVRALPAVASVLSLWLAWLVLRELMPRPRALATLALFAISPVQVLYSQEARPYSLVLVFEYGALLVLLRASRAPGAAGWTVWAVWAGLCALAGLSHLVALAWIPACVAYLVLAGAAGHVIRRAVGWGALAAAPALLWTCLDWRSIAHVNVSAQTESAAGFALGAAQSFGAGAFVPPLLEGVAPVLFGGLALLGVALGCAGRPRRAGRSRRLAPADAALLALGVLPLVLLWLSNQAHAVYVPKLRYALGAQLFVLAACVRGAWTIPSRTGRKALVAALLAVEAASLQSYFRGGPPALDLPPCKKPFRAAAELIRKHARSGDAVAVYELVSCVQLRLYLGGELPAGYVFKDSMFRDAELALLGRPRPLEDWLPRARRLWFVVAPVHYRDPLVVPADAAGVLSRHAVLEEDKMLPGIRVQLWRVVR